MTTPHASPTPSPHAEPSVQLRQETQGTALLLAGRLDAHGVAALWDEAMRLQAQADPTVLDLSRVTRLDGAGASLVAQLELNAYAKGRELVRRDPPAEQAALLALTDMNALRQPADMKPRRRNLPEEVGVAAEAVWRDFRETVTFVGAMAVTLAKLARHPRRMRWGDVWATMESAGADALPIVALIGSLMGLIMAFQSAIPLQRFGADIYIADMLGIAMVRELGALVTAILLAGRSGSAFAAEIGTMKVNEEIDAMTTMGLDAMAFLTAPRLVAACIVTPILTMFFNLFALAGGALVVMGFGYSFTTYAQRVAESITMGDMVGGLFKAFVFSILVAGIGCQRGLGTGSGARAVGASTTSAVVSGLVLIAVADGVMAVAFYSLGI